MAAGLPTVLKIQKERFMRYNQEWKDYQILATSNGEKLERWGKYTLLRPDPQVIWKGADLKYFGNVDGHYIRGNSGGGYWDFKTKLPESWVVGWRDLKFKIVPMGFKHTGLFPEQAYNWARMMEKIKGANRPIKVLNLFAYTGGATVACAKAGASVTHVDASKGMVERAKENLRLSSLQDAPVRTIIDDCEKFVGREIKRGNFYDAIILDPPSYGRGPNGEVWKIEDKVFDLLKLCKKVLSDKPLFVLLNSYTTGLQPTVLKNICKLCFDCFEKFDEYELGIPTDQDIILPCGASCFCEN